MSNSIYNKLIEMGKLILQNPERFTKGMLTGYITSAQYYLNANTKPTGGTITIETALAKAKELLPTLNSQPPTNPAKEAQSHA